METIRKPQSLIYNNNKSFISKANQTFGIFTSLRLLYCKWNFVVFLSWNVNCHTERNSVTDFDTDTGLVVSNIVETKTLLDKNLSVFRVLCVFSWVYYSNFIRRLHDGADKTQNIKRNWDRFNFVLGEIFFVCYLFIMSKLFWVDWSWSKLGNCHHANSERFDSPNLLHYYIISYLFSLIFHKQNGSALWMIKWCRSIQ